MRQYRGFTIVELLVAVGLFLTLLAMLAGSFIEALRSERATLRLMAANDNAALTLEQMAREIRVGTDFSLNGNSELHFKDRTGIDIAYRAAEGRLEKRVGTLGTFTPITANTVRVASLRFALSGESSSDHFQPRVTIALAIGATGRDIEGVVTAVQTTITPRLLDTP